MELSPLEVIYYISKRNGIVSKGTRIIGLVK